MDWVEKRVRYTKSDNQLTNFRSEYSEIESLVVSEVYCTKPIKTMILFSYQ